MRLVRDEQRVWMDAGPFFRFCEARQLPALARYLGPRGRWVQDVANEVELHHSSPNPRFRTHPSLVNLQRLGFPASPPTRLTVPQEEEVNDIRSEWADPGEHPKRHRGEIATVVVARDHGRELAIIDDGDGLALARAHNVPALSTTHVVAEMVIAGKLSEDEGREIFLSVWRARPLTEQSYVNALAQYRM